MRVVNDLVLVKHHKYPFVKFVRVMWVAPSSSPLRAGCSGRWLPSDKQVAQSQPSDITRHQNQRGWRASQSCFLLRWRKSARYRGQFGWGKQKGLPHRMV